MRRMLSSGVMSMLLVAAFGLLAACGGPEEDNAVRKREGMPFMRIKLRNTSPPDKTPANAEVVGTQNGQPGPTLVVGPVPPGDEQESQPPGETAADEVAITVTFEDGATFHGHGAWPGSFVSTVDIECAEPEGGMARVNFAAGRPAEEIPLHP